MVNNISQLDINGAFRHATTRRGHKKSYQSCIVERKKENCFGQILVRNWNILAYDTVNPSSVYHFKRSLQGVPFNGRGVSIVLVNPSSPLYTLYVLCIVNKQLVWCICVDCGLRGGGEVH